MLARSELKFHFVPHSFTARFRQILLKWSPKTVKFLFCKKERNIASMSPCMVAVMESAFAFRTDEPLLVSRSSQSLFIS